MNLRFDGFSQVCASRRFVAALVVGALAGCGPQAQPGGGGGGFPPAPVALLEIRPTNVPLQFEYVGQTAGSKEAEVRARISGILEKRVYREGTRVKAGEPLYVIDPKPYAVQAQAAEAELARAQAQHAQTRRELDRLKVLMRPDAVGAISERDFDSAVSAEETAAANVKLAQANLASARLSLSYTTVNAPVSGYASRSLKSEGSLVTAGQDSLLTTISQIDPIYVNFSITESEQLRLDRLRAGGKLVEPGPQAGGYEVSVRLADNSVFPRTGRMSFVDARINPATGAYDARAEIENADRGLRPGQFVRVILSGARRPDTVVVPQRAVMEGPQGKFVYVAGKSPDGKDIALPRPVTVSDWVEIDGSNQWIIEAGLQAGDQVVIDGMARLVPIPTGAPIQLGAPAAPATAPAGDGKK